MWQRRFVLFWLGAGTGACLFCFSLPFSFSFSFFSFFSFFFFFFFFSSFLFSFLSSAICHLTPICSHTAFPSPLYCPLGSRKKETEDMGDHIPCQKVFSIGLCLMELFFFFTFSCLIFASPGRRPLGPNQDTIHSIYIYALIFPFSMRDPNQESYPILNLTPVCRWKNVQRWNIKHGTPFADRADCRGEGKPERRWRKRKRGRRRKTKKKYSGKGLRH